MLKGKATIELTNIKTGKIQTYTEENLVTNAIQDILTMNPRGRLFRAEDGYESYDFLPVVPNLIGGILLYNDQLDETPERYYAPDTNALIGYASNGPSLTTDPKRGSLNWQESGPIENGYKFVFDFNTSEGNGTINALSLTSKWGGICGYGSTYPNTNQNSENSQQQSYSYAAIQTCSGTNSLPYDSLGQIENLWPLLNVISYNLANDEFISVYCDTPGQITIQPMKAKMYKWGLFEHPKYKQTDFKEKIVLTPESFGCISTSYVTFLNDEINNVIWGFDNGQGNDTGDAHINYIKINKNTWTFIEGAIALPDIQLKTLGHTYNNSWQKYHHISQSIIKDGYLYCGAYNNNGVYKINLNNTNDIIFMPGTIPNYPLFGQMGNIIYFQEGYILQDTIYPVTSHSTAISTYGNTIQYGPFLLHFYFYDNSGNLSDSYREVFYLMAPYLATINNLETEIIKTDETTMKITYILTET